MIHLKTPTELARMRQAGRLVAQTLALLEEMARPGLTTAELDRAAEAHIEGQGGTPSFRGYRGFPASICASLNEEVVHGIPGGRALEEGDLLKLDVGVIWEGYHGDAATTVAVGEVDETARELMRVTRQALTAGIAAVRAGARLSELSRAVQQTAEAGGFSVVTDYTGHGIGRELHEEPKVPNFVGSWLRRRDVALRAGMTLAIEPMVNVGTERTEVLANGWTVVTRDRELSAHFEHTVAVEDEGPVILTLP